MFPNIYSSRRKGTPFSLTLLLPLSCRHRVMFLWIRLLLWITDHFSQIARCQFLLNRSSTLQCPCNEGSLLLLIPSLACSTHLRTSQTLESSNSVLGLWRILRWTFRIYASTQALSWLRGQQQVSRVVTVAVMARTLVATIRKTRFDLLIVRTLNFYFSQIMQAVIASLHAWCLMRHTLL